MFYNKEQLCSKGDIDVTGENATSANETSCGSFRERTGSSMKDSYTDDCGCDKIQIDCKACLTYGTGVGGAIIENKQVYHGSSFSAGEFGAIITHAEEKLSGTDPFDGCYERYASATALVKMVSAVDPSLTKAARFSPIWNARKLKAVVNKWIDEIRAWSCNPDPYF